MSIDINWNSLTTGPSGQELAESIRNFIHDKFQQVQLPRFIRSVEIHTFNFGKESPIISLKDISDPLPDFYEDSEDEDEIEDGPVPERGPQSTSPSLQSPIPQPKASLAQRPTQTDTGIPYAHSSVSAIPRVGTPLLPRSNITTPGIPGGTSNLSYFHLPLSGPNLSRSQTPTLFTPPWSDPHHPFRPPSPPRTHQPSPNYADPSSRPSTSRSNALNLDQHPIPPSPPSQPESLGKADPLDLQTTMHISYTGSLSLSLTAEILLDYPMPSFVGIPLKLHITGLSFDGVALLAYLHGGGGKKRAQQQGDDGQGKGKVKFCFLGPEDARMMVSDEFDRQGEDGKDEEAAHDSKQRDEMGKKREDEGNKLGGLLREIRVESEIGRQEDGKQVLKNVGKVERFVLEQVRRIFEDEFVFPSFWTFLV